MPKMLNASCALAALGTIVCAPVAHAADQPASGTLFVTGSTYIGRAATIKVGQALPNSGGVTAIADGSYPGLFTNDTVDGNFGVTSPIALDAFLTSTDAAGAVVVGKRAADVDLTALTGVATSFSSKSELALNLSTNGSALTLMGYVSQPNKLDVSNANTPGHVDPTNTDTQTPAYRAIVQVDLDGHVRATATEAYSGNNGRAAILANDVNGSHTSEYLLAGNAGNGSSPPPTFIVQDAGVQIQAPGANPASTVVGALFGTPGSSTGYEYGFSVTTLGDPADKSGKDNNYRGARVFNNELYVSKGSGGNGVDTVYKVALGNDALPMPSTAPDALLQILPGFPTGLASAITDGDPATEFYPFGIWFANANTLYVADEGPQDLTADANAGLEKWIFDGTKWNLAYTIQAGLNLDQPYAVANYPTSIEPATTGLRNIDGVVHGNTVTIFGVTSTFSSAGDPGADPNRVVSVTDELDATSLPASEAFATVQAPRYGHVYRGVAYVPCRGGMGCPSLFGLADR
jgi:hypothetical protein